MKIFIIIVAIGAVAGAIYLFTKKPTNASTTNTTTTTTSNSGLSGLLSGLNLSGLHILG